MLARVDVNIDAFYVEKLLKTIMPLAGFSIDKMWHDDADFVVHVSGKINAKIKVRIISFKETFVGIDIKKVIIDGMLPISGSFIDVIMNSFKTYINRSLPFAEIKSSGSTIYLENIKSNNIKLQKDRIVGELFIDSNL